MTYCSLGSHLAALLVLPCCALSSHATDLFLLMGQSNMSGRGALAELPSFEYAASVFVYGNDGVWRRASEPVDDARGQVDMVSADPGPEGGPGDTAGASPALAFGAALAALTQRDIGLVPCAKGGSSIDQWVRDESRDTLYGSCLARARESAKFGAIRGIIYYQGESDTTLAGLAADWRGKFLALVASMRADLATPNLPVVYTKLGPDPKLDRFAHWVALQRQQDDVAAVGHSKVAMVSAADLPTQDDGLHLTTLSYVTLGRRYATAMHRLLQLP